MGGKREKRRKKLKKEGRRGKWETGEIVRCGAVHHLPVSKTLCLDW